MAGILPEKYQAFMQGKISRDEAEGNTSKPTLSSIINTPSTPTPYSSGNNYGINYTSTAPSYSKPSTPSYTAPATSYTGSANIIGNVNGSQDLGKSYQNILNANRTGDQQFKQLNTWADDKGNVYDTTNMSAQQSYALMLAKSGNPNAAAILKGMGLDMNGNSTSPNTGTTWGKADANGNYGGYNGGTSGTGTLQKDPRIDAMSTADQLAYYKSNPQAAQQEILRAKQVYDGATTDAQRNGAHTWADQLRQAAGISDSDTGYGNNNGVSPADQRNTLMNLLNGGNAVTNQSGGGMPTGQGSSGVSGNGQLNAGTGFGGNQPANGWTSGGQSQSNADLIKSIYDNNYASQAQKLKSARDQALAGLSNQDSIINQNATKDLNSNDVMSNQRMQQLKEAMANAGLSASGDNVSAQIGIGTSQQQGANDINTNKTNLLSTLMAKRNAINDNASADDLALMQQLQGTRDSQLLNQSNADRTFNYNASQDALRNAYQDRLFNYNAGRDTKNDATNAANTVYNHEQDTIKNSGNYDPNAEAKKEMAANSAEYANATPERQQWLHARNVQLATSMGASDQTGNGDYNLPGLQRTIAGKAADAQAATVALQQEGARINNEIAKLNLANYPEEQRLKIEQIQKQIAQIGKAPYQSATDAEYDRVKLDMAKEQLNQLKNKPPSTSGNFNLDDYKGYINQNYYKETPDPNDYSKTIKTFDQGSAERYILSLNVPSAQKAQLYQLYNIPLK